MQTKGEKEDEFRQRMNRAERDNPDKGASTKSDSKEWLFGPDVRIKGSIHSDIWRGDAAALYLKSAIGVAPTIGWWRERHQLERWKESVRYSLLISLEATSENVNLYEPLAAALKVAFPVAQLSA
jgi:hypothetical protein